MKKTGRQSAAIYLAAAMLIVGCPYSLSRVSATTTQEQLDKAKQEKAQSEAQVNAAQGHKNDMEQQKQNLEGQLGRLNEDLGDVSDRLEQLETDIGLKETEIEETGRQLEEAKQTEETQYENMKKRLRFIYERGDQAYLEMFFSSESFADFLNKNEYVMKMSEYDRNLLEEYTQTKQSIAQKEQDLIAEKEELDELKAQAEEEKKKVSGLMAATSNGIANYADKISDVEAAILAKEAEIKKQEENIAYLQKKLAEEKAMSSLAANSTWRDISQVQFDEGDRYLLANLIYCEAGGEPYAGQVAVGSVVINRVLSSVYPDTVVGVIYQNKQFSPVASGRLALALAENRATASCYKAADEAMAGMTNVGNCVYFRTPIPGLTGIQIGGHIFY
ncbi:MAG: cell wall hydrolase [Lachnospiraceae bacterium]|nr:cell wall hydrolase [Lachnospiraceae bacterium]